MHTSRRDVLVAAGAALAIASDAIPAAGQTKGKVRRIATEEGFTIPEIRDATLRLLAAPNDEPAFAATRKAGYLPINVADFPQRLASLGDLRSSS